jgi:diacylglycerol kinase
MNGKEVDFSWRKRLNSLTYAVAGLKQIFLSEHNTRIHFTATLIVLGLSIFFSVSRLEAIALIIVISLVWIAELINTCLEKTLDFITKEKRPEVKFIKDVAAAAVLIAAFMAVIAGSLIFFPKIFL